MGEVGARLSSSAGSHSPSVSGVGGASWTWTVMRRGPVSVVVRTTALASVAGPQRQPKGTSRGYS